MSQKGPLIVPAILRSCYLHRRRGGARLEFGHATPFWFNVCKIPECFRFGRGRKLREHGTKVYLAGKVRHGDQNWREMLMARTGPRPISTNLTWRQLASRTAPDVVKTISRIPLQQSGFELSGPYIVGREQPSYTSTSEFGAEVFSAANSSGTIDPETRDAARRVLLDLNTLLLEAADALFIWLDAIDAFGTMAEIGQAYGRKPIFLAFSTKVPPEQLNELWYSTHMADKVIFAGSPQQAFSEFITWHKSEASLVRAMT